VKRRMHQLKTSRHTSLDVCTRSYHRVHNGDSGVLVRNNGIAENTEVCNNDAHKPEPFRTQKCATIRT
jgi:hypothetical protein